MALGLPTPAPVPPALPPLSAGIKAGLLSWPGGPGPWHPVLTWRPQLSGAARQGEGAAVPIYLTGPDSAGHSVGRGQGRLWGQKHHSLVTTSNSLRVPRALEGAGCRGGVGPFIGKETSSSPFSRRRPRSALSGLHGPGGGERGTWLSSFTPFLPQVTLTALSPATGPVLSPPPLRKHGDPSPPQAHPQTGRGQVCAPGPALRSSQCARSRVCVSVCVCVCVAVS